MCRNLGNLFFQMKVPISETKLHQGWSTATPPNNIPKPEWQQVSVSVAGSSGKAVETGTGVPVTSPGKATCPKAPFPSLRVPSPTNPPFSCPSSSPQLPKAKFYLLPKPISYLVAHSPTCFRPCPTGTRGNNHSLLNFPPHWAQSGCPPLAFAHPAAHP
jgi:hypothetical protein